MAGWTIIPTNRALVCTPYIATHGTASTTYPLANLNDWTPWNQAWITPSSSHVRLKFTMPAAPSATSNTDWIVSGVSIVNHNLDGSTIELRYKDSDSGSTDNYATATAPSGFPITLDANSGNVNLLMTFTGRASQAWYLDITNSPATVKIGAVVLGPSIDLGEALAPEQFTLQPSVAAPVSVTGHQIASRLIDPVIVKSVVFTDPTKIQSAYTYDKSMVAGPFPTYNTVYRELGYAKTYATNSPGTATGIGGSGGAVPIAYHEGTAAGLSGAGRPSYYGTWNVNIARRDRASYSTLNCTIVDVFPRTVEVQPVTN